MLPVVLVFVLFACHLLFACGGCFSAEVSAGAGLASCWVLFFIIFRWRLAPGSAAFFPEVLGLVVRPRMPPHAHGYGVGRSFASLLAALPCWSGQCLVIDALQCGLWRFSVVCPFRLFALHAPCVRVHCVAARLH